MNATAIERRLKALEQRAGRANRPSVAFVLWERSREAVQAAFDFALAAGAVKRGDPIIMGVLPGEAPLPEPRWTDMAGLSDIELNALAVEEQRKVDGGETRPASSADWAAVRKMSDHDLCIEIVERLPRAS